MPSASIEDYIKTIYSLEADQQRATTQRIAKRMGVRMASVTGMIKHLAAEGYLVHKPYRGVELTERGQRLALTTIRRHRIIELFLQQTLGLRWDEVHDDAEILEHAVSDRLIERIHQFLGEPAFDPHGAPIPESDGTVRRLQGKALSECPTGARGVIVHVSDRDPEFLRYLSGIGLVINTGIEVVQVEPFDGPITLRCGRRRIVIGKEAARRILVSPSRP